MTPRMTLGLAVLALGFTVAALAGIPVLIENRSIGDVVVVIGIAVGIVGGILMLSAIPSQRAAGAQRKRDAEAEVAGLRAQRTRIRAQLKNARDRKRDAQNGQTMSMTLISGRMEREKSYTETIRALELEEALLVAELEANAAELRRHGIEASN